MSSINTVVLYHKNCDDGFGSAWAAWTKYKDSAKYIPISYQDKLDLDLIRDKNLLIVDFSFPRDYLNLTIKPIVKNLTLLDHHKSAMAEWTDSSQSTFNIISVAENRNKLHIEFNMDKSGALLTWEHLFPGVKVPKLISHISDSDLFRFQDENTRDFKKYLNTIRTDFKSWDVVGETSEVPQYYAEICQTGRSIRKYHERMVMKESMSRKVRDITIPIVDSTGIKVYKGLCINTLHSLASDVGEILSQRSQSFALMWETNGDTCFCSIRSIRGFNCIPIAKYFGGGGHETAAGFSMKYSELLNLLNSSN